MTRTPPLQLARPILPMQHTNALLPSHALHLAHKAAQRIAVMPKHMHRVTAQDMLPDRVTQLDGQLGEQETGGLARVERGVSVDGLGREPGPGESEVRGHAVLWFV